MEEERALAKKRGLKVSESKKEKKKRRLILNDSESDDDMFMISPRTKGSAVAVADQTENCVNDVKVEAKSDLGAEVVKQTEEPESKQKVLEVHQNVEKIEEDKGPKVGADSFIRKESIKDLLPSKEEIEVEAKTAVKRREGTDRSHQNGKVSLMKERYSLLQRGSTEEEMKVEVNKVLKSEIVKEREGVDSDEGLSQKKDNEGQLTMEEIKGGENTVLKLTAVKRREIVESVKKKTVVLGKDRKRNREALDENDDDDDASLKRLRSWSVRSRPQPSSATDIDEKNIKRGSLISGDKRRDIKADCDRHRNDSSEKRVQGNLKRKNKLEAESGRCTDESTVRTLWKMKDSNSSSRCRREEFHSSQLKSIRVQSKTGVLRILPGNKDVGRLKGVHIQTEDEENRKGAANHPPHSRERKVEKHISISKSGKNQLNSRQVSLDDRGKPKKKTKVGISSPNVKQKTVGSSHIKTDSIAETKEMRSTMKQKIRDQIKEILFDAGWKVELRPRRGRAYEDAVYVPPSGRAGYWSITKAYAVYLEDCKNGKNPPENSSKKFHNGEQGRGGTSSSFATISPDLLRMLTRNVVKKRRSSKEMKEAMKKLGGRKKGKEILKTKDSRKNGEDVGSTAHKRKLKGRNKKQRGCALLVRGANQDAEADDDDDYVPYIGKRTILAWMIDLGILHIDGKVKYMNKSHSRALLEGSITRDGIRCSCCSKIISVSKFEIHAGSKLHQPYLNIFVVESRKSLLQCQLNAWEKQQDSGMQGFIKLDVDGDDPNDDTCGICGDGGDLICCDGCPSTFHLNCLGIQMLPPGEWHCTNCSCRYCGSVSDAVLKGSGSTISTLLTCSQCDKKYHHECIPEVDAISVSSGRSGKSFCGQSCKKVFKQLQKLIGTKNDLEAGLSWSVVRCFHEDSSGRPCNLPQKAECNSKIAVAFAVMDECFRPIIDQRSGMNLIHNVVHNCGSNINRLSYTGFYTFLLERGDEIISVASVRIHGTRLAEMPFIGTRNMYRRQGMCRQLLNGIESALYSLNVEKLIIPAISELTETWTSIFGFKPLGLSQKEEVKSINMLVFPGTGLLHKPILKDSTELLITFNGVIAELGDSTLHKTCCEVVQPEHEIGEEIIIETNENSDADGPPLFEVQTLQCNSSGTVVDQNEFKGEDTLSVNSSDEPKAKIPSEGSLHGNPETENAASAIESENCVIGSTSEPFHPTNEASGIPECHSPNCKSPETFDLDLSVQPQAVCCKESMGEDIFQLDSNSNTKSELPCEGIMLDTRIANGWDATVASSLHALDAISVGNAQEATTEKTTHNLLSNGVNVVVECKSPGDEGFPLQDSDASHLSSSEPTSKLTSSSMVVHDSLAAGQHIADSNHVVQRDMQEADGFAADGCIKPGHCCSEGLLDTTSVVEDNLVGVAPVVSFGLSSLCRTSKAVIESSN